ncbi:MAG: rhomboid family intramembrane serine protease [Deltaproteobacteria bacterium]|nr:rhomboid family intramembrane serine protease [Deltaproteobacteria bacterium]
MSARRPPERQRFKFGNLGITRGALIIAGIELGLSLVWLMSNKDARFWFDQYFVATPSNVFEHYRLWTLVTSPFLQRDFLGLILHVMMLWMFVPTLERFWGTARFYRFVAITSLAGTLIGTITGLLLGHDLTPISGLTPFIFGSVVAFGIIYAKQPVQFFGVLPLTGRQLMYGFIGFQVLFITLQGMWAQGAATAAGMIAAALMTSKRWSPGLAWKRWKIQRARAKLTVMQGGQTGKPAAGKRDEQKWLN